MFILTSSFNPSYEDSSGEMGIDRPCPGASPWWLGTAESTDETAPSNRSKEMPMVALMDTKKPLREVRLMVVTILVDNF